MNQYTLKDLLIAYRKVKADMYYDKNNISLLKLADYEQNLLENLDLILQNLNKNNLHYFTSREFVGGINISLKSLNLEGTTNEGLIFSDEFDKNKIHKIKNINFRYVGDLPIEFQILGSLWIDKIGIHLEKKLSKNSYGCRLDRQVNEKQEEDYENLNGHFRPYFFDYKAWQDESLKTITTALKDNKKIAVLSTDIKGFYHSIDPAFLINYFNSNANDFIEFSNLNYIFSESLITWSKINYAQVKKLSFKLQDHLGIPIGLSASKVIANLYLEELDVEIEKCLNPVFYGRYVDDIILAIEDKVDLENRNQLWDFIEKRLHCCSFRIENNTRSLIFEKSHFVDLSFNREKEKIFLLNGKSGIALIETIQNSMIENSSEWRLLPDAEHDIDNLNKQFTSSTTDNNEAGTTLRKADGVSIQRLKFSLRLRNFEKLILNTPKNEWENPLKEFVEICSDFIINPSNISTFSQYIPRIFGLITSSGNLFFLEKILKSYKETFRKIENGRINKSQDERLKMSKEYLDLKIVETILTNQNYNDKKNTNQIENLLKENLITINLSSKEFRAFPVRLFLCDLHKIPFKNVFLSADLPTSKESASKHLPYFNLNLISLNLKTFNLNLLHRFVKVNRDLKRLLDLNLTPNALYFCTRKFSALELSLIITSWSHSIKNQKKFIEYLHLFSIRNIEIEIKENYGNKDGLGNNLNFIKLKSNKEVQNPHIILTNFYTDAKSWVAHVRNDNFEPDKSRYTRLNRLINNILEEIRKNKISLQYIILPELSMPRHSLIEIAKKLRSKGISLIVGVEYQKKLHNSKNNNGLVYNQLLYVLNAFNGSSYDQVAITQEKTVPAIHEESELYNTGGLSLSYKSEMKYVFDHNNFFFSGLICNDLLNIDYRQALRGKIDMLIVVEWNKDIDMYNNIVAATSNDLHCFVAQVNNRSYGDTRLRGPFKESYERDVARIKGGDLDFFVVTTVKAIQLRDFQRNYKSPEKPFKPVPTGFEISEFRRLKDLKN
ncbi:RNA-directed DNA polymerase [Flavobacterium pectinovorum]|uniref:RNA-directed DNA polymerase n=1 Tax=Flavobacterium pectinovorum TaxID=29533 RepID=A0A502F5H7_9FLAO|nr:RNA-directed DNA polymerase [Flavobacterium pectinovorum]TPG44150.1 RNA-directed DNA polymerase [Flavobacterium pectinovorum]